MIIGTETSNLLESIVVFANINFIDDEEEGDSGVAILPPEERRKKLGSSETIIDRLPNNNSIIVFRLFGLFNVPTRPLGCPSVSASNHHKCPI